MRQFQTVSVPFVYFKRFAVVVIIIKENNHVQRQLKWKMYH